MPNHDSFVLCDNLVKIYKVADLEVVALQGLDLEVTQGEMMALVGPSGAGKSTLLNVIGGLDTPSAGNVQVGDWDLLQIKDHQRVRYKQRLVGFVWQQPSRNLLPYLTARENIELPMMLTGVSAKKRQERAFELLDIVGLVDRATFKPERLSGGQQQRIALCVALANNPPLLLGDEITGQIDSQSAAEVYHALRQVNAAYNTTIILVTHDPLVSKLVDRVVAIRDGRTSTEIRRRLDKASGDIHEEEWVILDQVGRLQIPKPYMEKLGLRERVKLRLEDDHVTVWPESKVQEFIQLGEPDLKPFSFNGKRPGLPEGPAVQIEALWRTFDVGAEKIHALREIHMQVPSGKFILVKGRSGSGKTTLLNLIAGLDDPTQGSLSVGGRELNALNMSEKIELRRRQIGFVFQTFGLLPFLTVEENIAVPLRLVRMERKERNVRVEEALAMVGLAARAHHRTYELSGGEQQRVAIARALVNRPALILADEPTGQLDSATGRSIIELLHQIVEQTGVTVIVASHDANMLEVSDVVFELQDGQLVKEEYQLNVQSKIG
jgi:peptide/nickel transport system ATP-binding protein